MGPIRLSMGEKIEDILKERKMTQKQLAEKAVVSASRINDIISGKGVTTKTLIGICNALEVSADYLLGLSDVPSLDVNLRTACEYTGLSSDAVSYLHVLFEVSKLPPYANRAEFFSEVITDKQFDLLLALWMRYVTLSSATTSLEYSTTAEYSAISNMLKQHGYTVALPDQQAQALFSERITNIMRNILDRLAEEKSDGND